jgi:hypothetical protein
MRKTILTFILLLSLMPLLAQIDLPRPNFNPYTSTGNSLLSLNKLSMRHSMGFEAGTSSLGEGYYLSRYTNHLMYSFNPKLELNLDLNFVSFGSLNTTNKFELNKDNSSKVIPEFSLRYKPTDNILVQVQMVQGGLYRSFHDSLNDTNW